MRLKKIVDFAGSALAMVSTAWANCSNINKKTRGKLFEIVCENQYRPSTFGIAMKKEVNENIGIFFYHEQNFLWGNPFYSRILEGIKTELAEHSYNSTFTLFQNSSEKLSRVLHQLEINGIIVIGNFNEKFLTKMKYLKLPAIFVDPQIRIKNYSQVLINNEDGAFNATQYLINAGHRKIGFISDELKRLSLKQRYQGYLKALQYYSIQLNQALIQTGGFENGYQHIKNILANQQPTAIFAANDINAHLGYRAIFESNLKMPDDISMVGFDDIHMSRCLIPALTTMRVPKEKMGSMAVRTLLNMIHNPAKEHSIITMPIELIERESVKIIASG